MTYEQNLVSGSKDADGGVHQLETLESSVHQASMTSLSWTNFLVTDSLANSIVKGDASEDAVISSSPFSDPVRCLFDLCRFDCLSNMILSR